MKPQTVLPSERHSQRGFSLVELIIAMAILSLLAVMLFSILGATSDLWKNNEEAVSSFREARAALNVMARDVAQSFADPEGGLPTFVINPAQSEILQPSEAAMNSAWGNRLFFLATLSPGSQAVSSNRSDLCAMGYYLAFTRDSTVFSPDLNGAGSFSYKLFRYFKNSDETFAALTAGLSKGTGSNPDSFDLKKIFTPAISSTAAGDEILARNITQLRLKIFQRVTDPVTGAFAGVKEFDLTSGAKWPIDERPAMIEVTLTALPDKVSARLTDKAAWEDHTSIIQQRNARDFVSRVSIP